MTKADTSAHHGSVASGEELLGRVLDSLRPSGVWALHDRKLPGSVASVDHVVVAPSGVFTTRR